MSPRQRHLTWFYGSMFYLFLSFFATLLVIL